jgi:hypothetical protein
VGKAGREGELEAKILREDLEEIIIQSLSIN